MYQGLTAEETCGDSDGPPTVLSLDCPNASGLLLPILKGVTMQHMQQQDHDPERLLPMPHEKAKKVHSPKRENWPKQVGKLSLIVFGLFCHLLIFRLLSFPYVYTYDPYYQASGSSSPGVTFVLTGWQAHGSVLLLPVLPYLVCLLFIVWTNRLVKNLLETIFYANVVVNVGGFLLVYASLILAHYGEFNKEVYWLDAAYGTHVYLLLLAVVGSIASSVGLSQLLRRSRKLRFQQI